MIDAEQIRAAHEKDILVQAQMRGAVLKRVAGGEYVGPCPICGGVDRFAIAPKKRVWNCRQCARGGDVIALVQHLDGVDFREAVERLAGGHERPAKASGRIPAASLTPEEWERREDRFWRGEPPPAPIVSPAPERDNDGARLKLALNIFGEAVDAHETEVDAYLAARKLELPSGDDALRFHSRCPFGLDRVPCMVALFRDNLSNEPVGIQRTRLPLGGWGRGMKMERKNLGPTGSGSIKIDADADVLYGITVAEGTETALAGRMLGYRPAWATGGKGTLKRFPVLPEPVQSLSVHWESDAADDVRQCVERWSAAGRETIILKSLSGKDAADALWEEP
jgi:putative DNA primase/helicase